MNPHSKPDPLDLWLQSINRHISSLVKQGNHREAESTILGIQKVLQKRERTLTANAKRFGDPDGAIALWMAVLKEEQLILSGHLSVVRLSLPNRRSTRDEDC